MKKNEEMSSGKTMIIIDAECWHCGADMKVAVIEGINDGEPVYPSS